MRPKTYTITTFDELAARKVAHAVSITSEARLIVAATKSALAYESLCRMCRKHYTKHGGLDLGYLSGSSMLKSMTREARRHLAGDYGMDADRQARYALAGDILEWCYAAGLR